MTEKIKNAVKGLLPCYDPGAKIGVVKAAYAVVMDAGTTPQPGTNGMLGQKTYEIVILVPLDKQNELDDWIVEIRKALAGISNLKYTGECEPSSIEQEFRGAAKSLLFRQAIRLI